MSLFVHIPMAVWKIDQQIVVMKCATRVFFNT